MPKQTPPKISRGIDLTTSGALTPAEVSKMKDFYREAQGAPHPGLEFWIENGPDQLKNYRRFTAVGVPGLYETDRLVINLPNLPFFAMVGYERGVQYMVHTRQKLGLTKSQVMEGLAIAFLVVGPSGMETIARALADFPWSEPAQPAEFPKGWAADYQDLRAGLDFTTEVMSADELAMLKDWFMRKTGEIPPYVEFLGRYRPNLLKTARNRWENCLSTLPIQFLPATLLHFEVLVGRSEGIRENVLLCRSFGVSREITLSIVFSALVNAGTTGASIAQRAAGDIFDNWYG